MKKNIVFIVVFLTTFTSFSQGYKITLNAPQYKAGIAYLTYYFGSSLNIADSGTVSNNGVVVFKNNKKLPTGIYVIVFPGKRLKTEFLLDTAQNINIKADTTDFLNKTVILGSKENDLFVAYQKFVAIKGKQLDMEQKAYANAKTKIDSLNHEKKYKQYSIELANYRENLIKTKPTSMMAVLLNAMKEPAILNNKPATKADSLNNYYYYKNHYWDGVSFMDEALVRTPFFLKKVETYYRDIISQSADSIISDLDYKLLLARSCPEMYKFLLNWATDEYIDPKYMGQDAVFVHLFENYHSKGLTNWLNEKQKTIVSNRAYMLMSNLVGNKAANLEMLDTSGKPNNLYDVNATYTIVCFWDPNCGHCRIEIPRLDSIYQASWKAHGIKIYAVLSPNEKDDIRQEWLKFINEHHLQEWSNVYKDKAMEAAEKTAEKLSYKQLYDVILTPKFYLLDKDKHIMAKQLNILQINQLLEVKWNNKI